MTAGEVLVIGGTRDARQICQQLDNVGVNYTLSVATPAGVQLASDIRGQVRCGRLDIDDMVNWLVQHRTRWVIDASHPYADVVSRNIAQACTQTEVLLNRYQRPEQQPDLQHPKLFYAATIDEACVHARNLGERVLLTTGSKDLAHWRKGLTGKTLLVRVLPVASVIDQCAALGFGVDEIIAVCGPCSAAFNAACYQQYRVEVMVTKASGAEGGYLDKIQPALDAGIACIVLRRPQPVVTGDALLESLDAFAQRLQRWLAAQQG